MSEQEGPRFRIEGRCAAQSTGWVWLHDCRTVESAEDVVDALLAFDERKDNGKWEFRAHDRVWKTWYKWRWPDEGNGTPIAGWNGEG